MSDQEIDHVFFCDGGMSLSEYKELLDLIQSEHPFPSMPSGANIKYVDSDVHLHNILDTRDSSLFSFQMQLRGFSKVLFTEHRGIFDPAPHKKSTTTGKSMYNSVLDYLRTKGAITSSALSSSTIGKLRGMQAIFGAYCGRRVLEEHVMTFPFVHDLLGTMDRNFFVVRSSNAGEGEDKTTGFLLFDDSTRHASLYTPAQDLVFKGKLDTQSDLLHALRITGIAQSF